MKSNLLDYAKEFVNELNILLDKNNLEVKTPVITYDDFWGEVIIKYSDDFIFYVEDIDNVDLLAIDEEWNNPTDEEILSEWQRAIE